MKAIIFGANGQDGFYLTKLLQSKNIEVIPTSRKNSKFIIDVADTDSVSELIKNQKPNYIFHLAANSTTRHSALFENHAAISTGTINILEAVKNNCPDAKVFISGSGLQFQNLGKPIKETDLFEAKDAYSVARIHSAYAARYYRRLGIKAYIGYFFNHDSPIRTDRHINRIIADAVLKIANGVPETIEIGNMHIKKEWGFAGDIVDAIWLLLQQDDVSEATIGTGEAYSIKQYIELCFQFIGKDWKEFVKEKEHFKTEYDVLVSDPETIHSLGWKSKTSFEQLTKMMLGYE